MHRPETFPADEGHLEHITKEGMSMAKRNNRGSKASSPAKKAGRSPTVDTSGAISTPVRNTSIPRPSGSINRAATPQRQITHEMIAVRAYQIWQSGKGGSKEDHWYQAERELRMQ